MSLRKPAINQLSGQAGYTMLELIVVLLIIAILVTILIWKNT